ncbi:hypothetical protein PAHAL_5G117200 [Panicum hallii]|uniref:Uncharacterized protein n=1 Tax=Panicum hallii TaxID=206008 RepID=A0A2T8IJR1_9POAL|nr:hypothetical protein PAHAL_5G117200 [Panicum hallii]
MAWLRRLGGWAPAPAPPPYKTPSATGPCRLSRLPPRLRPLSSAPAIPAPLLYLLARPRLLRLTPAASRALRVSPPRRHWTTRRRSIADDDR